MRFLIDTCVVSEWKRSRPAPAVLDWLDIRRLSPRLVANAGDQVPPGAPEFRIDMMRGLVEKHGRY